MKNDNKKINKKKNIEYWENRLKGLGYKITEPRRAIISIFGNESKLYKADEIYLIVKKDYPDIGISTIYRTLELLTRLKLICKFNLGSERSYYLLSKDCYKDTAIYMICDNCGRVIIDNDCLNNAVKIRLIDNAEKHIFKNCMLKVSKFQIIFSGLCDKCVVGKLENPE